MFITKEDLYSHIRAENAELITRGDDAIICAAIDGATSEARGYLADYDLEGIFSAQGAQRNPLLLIFVKDIAVWHLINLCSNGANYKTRQARYERAIEWLKSVQKGFITPDLPRKTDPQGKPSSLIYSTSNPKKTQHF